ncbi:MAG: MotA/TolQ/ExbB proton channel family protein [Elusimicrobiota bacterium]
MAGILIAAGMLVFGVVSGELSSALFNTHAFFVVFGGTITAMLINTPLPYLSRAVFGLGMLFRGESFADPARVIPVMVELAEKCRTNGLSALKEADQSLVGGFLNRAAMAALEYNDYNFVKQVLEQEINQSVEEMNETVNVYRTMGVLMPMFGLLGTLIGIIAVLRELANPENVGPAMAVAITSAFYGIFFANMVCVPIAGKMRARIWMEVRVKSMIMEGVLEIMKGSIPIVVERRLQAYLG